MRACRRFGCACAVIAAFSPTSGACQRGWSSAQTGAGSMSLNDARVRLQSRHHSDGRHQHLPGRRRHALSDPSPANTTVTWRRSFKRSIPSPLDRANRPRRSEIVRGFSSRPGHRHAARPGDPRSFRSCHGVELEPAHHRCSRPLRALRLPRLQRRPLHVL